MNRSAPTSKAGEAERVEPLSCAPSGQGLSSRRTSTRFYVCLVCLLLSAATLEVSARWLGQHFQKLPVPLKATLASMDPRKLLPEYELHFRQPEPLSAEVIETLGTDEYLSWNLVDLSREQSDPASTTNVFVSYFTGKPDMVPHVPEECIRAAGATLVGANTIWVAVPGVGAPEDRVPLRILEFEAVGRGRSSLLGTAAGKPTFHVLYFFHVNGRYCTTRTEARLYQSNLFDRYAYYAKVEIRFNDHWFRQDADEQEAIAAVQPLLRKFLPILLRDHMPDWETLTADTTAEEAGRGEKED